MEPLPPVASTEATVGQLTAGGLIGVVVVAVFVVLLLVVLLFAFVTFHRRRKGVGKGPPFLASDFEAENTGVVCVIQHEPYCIVPYGPLLMYVSILRVQVSLAAHSTGKDAPT